MKSTSLYERKAKETPSDTLEEMACAAELLVADRSQPLKERQQHRLIVSTIRGELEIRRLMASTS